MLKAIYLSVNLDVDVREYFLVSYLFLAGVTCSGQSDTSKFIRHLSGKIGYSSIWTGRESLQQFTKDHPWSAQVDLGIIKNTQQAWNYCNCYSENGLSLGYINFAKPAKLGHAITVSIFAEPYLLSRKRFHLSLRGGAGFAFLNNVYDSIANKDNIFFSTNLSFVLGLGVTFSWQLNHNWKLTTSAQFNHISNGGRKDPNEGMNFPGATLGLNYGFSPLQLQRRTKERFTGTTTRLVVHGFGNIRTAWATANWAEEKRVVTGANIGVIKRLGRISGLGAGGEYYYDGINEVYQQRSGQTIQTTAGGASVQHYLFFGKLLFGQQLVWYVTPNTGFKKNLYQRYLLEYEVKRNWYAGFTLKARGDQSDFFAFSTGYFFEL